jgi:hypothetical protein
VTAAGRPPAVRYLIGNTLAILIGLASAYVALRLSGVGDVRIIDIRTVDLVEYLSMGRLIAHGHGGAMYEWHAFYSSQLAIVGRSGSGPFGALPFLYGPAWAFPFVPLSLLPYDATYLLWIAINGFLLMLVLYQLEQYALLSGRAATAFRWASLTFVPVFLTLMLGQVSIVILAAATGALVALRRDHQMLAGAVIALGCFKPAYFAPVLLVLLMRRCWRALGGFAAAGLVLLLAPLPIVGLSIYRSYLTLLSLDSSWQGKSVDKPFWYHGIPVASSTYAPQWNHSFSGQAELIAQGHVAPALLYVPAIILALLVVTWSAMRASSLDLPFALAMVVGLLVSPHTLAYDYAILLLPVATALRYREGRSAAIIVLLACGYFMVVLGVWLAFAIHLQTTVVAAVLLLAWLAVAVYQERRPLSEPRHQEAPELLPNLVAARPIEE